MNKISYNNCIRCGKERKVIRTWEEKIEGSTIINTESVCPDPSCQKLVEADNKKSRDRHAAMKQKSQERALRRRASADAVRASSKTR